MEDYDHFLEKIDDFDRRLATIICQAYDDCSGLESIFKVRKMYCDVICTDLFMVY